ncbi:MAG: recombination protein RecR [Candidatus Sungbacteria bacterium]|nr:recombination protein RecR [Candidatus Sungbacteria bacterium]
MHPKAIKHLIHYFQRLPGVGPRQASRFTYSLLDEPRETVIAIAAALKALTEKTERCAMCFRARETTSPCQSCNASETERRILVVEKDQDAETVEKSGMWRGTYHIIGGTISPLREDTILTHRIRGLYERVASLARAKKSVEIVMALSATANGEATQAYIEKILEPFLTPKGQAKITRLGRGLSTGAEIEYADPNTLSHALKNRK